MKITFCCEKMGWLCRTGHFPLDGLGRVLVYDPEGDKWIPHTSCPFCGAAVEVGMKEPEKKHAWEEGLFLTMNPKILEKLKAMRALIESLGKELGERWEKSEEGGE